MTVEVTADRFVVLVPVLPVLFQPPPLQLVALVVVSEAQVLQPVEGAVEEATRFLSIFSKEYPSIAGSCNYFVRPENKMQ